MDIDAGFGLWLCADHDVDERLSAAIAALAARFGGPAFSPHLTLAAGFGTRESALESAQSAALELDDSELRFSDAAPKRWRRRERSYRSRRGRPLSKTGSCAAQSPPGESETD